MDKLIEEGSGTTITNDGATVMKKLNIATLHNFTELTNFTDLHRSSQSPSQFVEKRRHHWHCVALYGVAPEVHPAARILVDISKAQDNEVGDGTTSVVVITGSG